MTAHTRSSDPTTSHRAAASIPDDSDCIERVKRCVIESARIHAAGHRQHDDHATDRIAAQRRTMVRATRAAALPSLSESAS